MCKCVYRTDSCFIDSFCIHSLVPYRHSLCIPGFRCTMPHTAYCIHTLLCLFPRYQSSFVVRHLLSELTIRWHIAKCLADPLATYQQPPLILPTTVRRTGQGYRSSRLRLSQRCVHKATDSRGKFQTHDRYCTGTNPVAGKAGNPISLPCRSCACHHVIKTVALRPSVTTSLTPGSDTPFEIRGAAAGGFGSQISQNPWLMMIR